LDAKDSTADKPVRRRKQQRTVDTRLKIVKAALAEFAMVGFDSASTRRIADAANVPHSLVIYHFKSKDQLWYETIKESVQWYTRRDFGVFPPLAEDDPTARLKRVFAHFIRFSADHPDFFRALTHENALASERLVWLAKHHVGPTLEQSTELIRRAQALGTFVEGDPLTLMYLFLGSATSPYRSAREIELITGKSTHDPAAIQRHIETCERLFFRTPKA